VVAWHRKTDIFGTIFTNSAYSFQCLLQKNTYGKLKLANGLGVVANIPSLILDIMPFLIYDKHILNVSFVGTVSFFGSIEIPV